jgi:thioredoxin reductase/Pyruvate/2-oxoacid:ferredoxin oxidoreductase delta subunit
MARNVRERDLAGRIGSHRARLRHPVIDLSRCLGCGTCVAACPEDGVLELVHGQAAVVHGARCEGIAACERECPVGAIQVTLADGDVRRDVPVVSAGLEALGSPGLFLAGEVTAHALIKSAIEQGAAVAGEVARRVEGATVQAGKLDLVIVGAGPAGLACSLEAKRLGLRFATLEQASGPGGAVARYPRRKLVLTQPVDLPLHGRLGRTSYSKEELMGLWNGICAEHELPLSFGEELQGVEPDDDGGYVVRTSAGTHRARFVCLALGRRGTPNRLGVPGEDLAKVSYSLLDAHSYRGRRVLVVGGGDSAVETALALAEQDGNEVSISYRREAFFRLRERNRERLERALAEGRLQTLTSTRVTAIEPGQVELALAEDGAERPLALDNDEVFILAGGRAPFELLERSGVSFDPALRARAEAPAQAKSDVSRALGIGLALALCAVAWALWHCDYYALPFEARPANPKHALLRPGRGVGLAFGFAAAALVVLNLAYLLRRAARRGFRFGSLRSWMSVHVATGILAFLCAVLHAAMAPRDTAGGHALWALAALIATGAVGRYFYAWVPRAANGRELHLSEVKAELSSLAAEWDDGEQDFRRRVRSEVAELIERRQWRGSLLGRVLALCGLRLDLRRALRRLDAAGRAADLSADQIDAALQLARKGYRTALMAAHYEDLRALLASWRYLHRWVALLLVLLILVHVAYALTYGALLEEGGLR